MLKPNQLGALLEVVSRHASDEAYYLKEGGPRRDNSADQLAEVCDTREHIWSNCADALEALGASSGEIDEARNLAKQWAELKVAASSTEKRVYLIYDGRSANGDTDRAIHYDTQTSLKAAVKSAKSFGDGVVYSYREEDGKLSDERLEFVACA